MSFNLLHFGNCFISLTSIVSEISAKVPCFGRKQVKRIHNNHKKTFYWKETREKQFESRHFFLTLFECCFWSHVVSTEGKSPGCIMPLQSSVGFRTVQEEKSSPRVEKPYEWIVALCAGRGHGFKAPLSEDSSLHWIPSPHESSLSLECGGWALQLWPSSLAYRALVVKSFPTPVRGGEVTSLLRVRSHAPVVTCDTAPGPQRLFK